MARRRGLVGPAGVLLGLSGLACGGLMADGPPSPAPTDQEGVPAPDAPSYPVVDQVVTDAFEVLDIDWQTGKAAIRHVYHLEDGFCATQASCTHVFAPLGRGKIVDGCRIRCPLHHAEFEIRTGEVHTWANFPPGIQLLNVVRSEKALKTYRAVVEDGEVVVEV